MENKSYIQSNSRLPNRTKMKRAIIALLSVLLILSIGTVTNAKSAPESFSGLVKKTSPSVVYISTKTIIKNRYNSPYGQNDPRRDFLERLFGGSMSRDIPRSGLGTGFIIDKEGYILTNNHVVENADEIKVTLEDDREFQAKIIGRDPETDIALIKIDDADNLNPLEFGDSDKLEVGDWVIAIGNPYGLGHTVTAGIVSAKFRNNVIGGTFDNFIQTDASINPGNSGGPLVNINGEVIGINSVIKSPTGGSVGIGFAIPINMAKDILPMLKSGEIERGYLGVGVQNIDSDLKIKFDLKNEKGALINHVYPESPSEQAGLKVGDVIISFQKKEIKDMANLIRLVSSTPVGTKAEVVVIRNGKKETFNVELGKRPGSDEAAIIEQSARLNLGMEVEALTPEKARRYRISDTDGLLVLNVDYNSSAAEAGLRQGDIILEVDREKMNSVSDFNKKLLNYKPGDTILLLIKRGNNIAWRTLKIREE